MALKQTSVAPTLTSSLLLEPYTPTSLITEVDEDEFEDATPEVTMDLEMALEECEVAVQKFFVNDLHGAMNIMKPWSSVSLYHSLGSSIFEFIPAILTFDHTQILRALAAIKACITICNDHRKNFTLVESIGTIIKKQNFSQYTDLEAHAELCYAEASLLQAAMVIMEGEDLTALLKGTLKVKNCYNSYKDCAKIIEKKAAWESEASKVNFESGVRFGVATFNLMISLLPPKVIAVLEFVGFSGNKERGLTSLMSGSRAPGLRSVLCDMTLLAYHLVICHFIGATGDLELCDEILRKALTKYPNSVWFLLFLGRLRLLQGEFEPAIDTYERAVVSQDIWPQFRHVCYWEIMWVNAIKMNWREASVYADHLIQESTWSRTINYYTKAVLLMELTGESTDKLNIECSDLISKSAKYKQRIAGKSLPMEKFMIKRCARYHEQKGHLVLPAVELLCLWNMFSIVAKNHKAAHNILKLIESTRNSFEKQPKSWEAGYEADNRALLRYLHGCCLAAMGLPAMAINILDSIFELKSAIKQDTFLLPYAVAEMAMCHYNLGDKERAIQMLHDARKKFSGYSLESRLHFRIHSKTEIVKGVDQSTDTSA